MVGAPVSNRHLMERDLKHVWHPCTQMRDHETFPIVPIQKGEGVWLYDFEGRRILDGISSWWTNLFGHAHPQISQALAKQAGQLEHVLLAGFTHEPAVELAERLVARAPKGLNKVFFADNGSSAVEVALKMSFHFWQNTGQPLKKRFVALEHGYHGETLGALAVSDVGLYKDTYRPLLFDVTTVPSPGDFIRSQTTADECARRHFASLDALLAREASHIAAVIVEPLVQCAGGMKMYSPHYLTLLREACTRHGVHFIADEIAVGFGRTGHFFACDSAGVTPDFMCLSKGLTAGYMPLSAVLTREEIFEAFYGSSKSQRAFLHSHSFTGNPLACAVANASLQIFDSTPVLENNLKLAQKMASWMPKLLTHQNIGEVRQTGMTVALDFFQDKSTRTLFASKERRGLALHRHALTNGLLIRPLGNTVYLMPPYVITEAEIDFAFETLVEALNSQLGEAPPVLPD
jgi:adenosylmethionine---8-amino-7-oxononanoate aminotransferase